MYQQKVKTVVRGQKRGPYGHPLFSRRHSRYFFFFFFFVSISEKIRLDISVNRLPSKIYYFFILFTQYFKRVTQR